MGRLLAAGSPVYIGGKRRTRAALFGLIVAFCLLLSAILADAARAETGMVDWGVNQGTTLGFGWSGVGPGNLGVGFESNHEPTPQQVLGLSHVREVVGGWHVQYALLESGEVWAVGSNGFGELGDGTNADSATPVRVGTLKNVTAIAAAGYHAMALTEEGRLWMWGAANAGQLGNGLAEAKAHAELLTPQENTTLTNVKAIGAGGATNFAIVEEAGKRVVKSWGGNAGGILGIGSTSLEECEGEKSSKIKCAPTPQNVQGLPSGETPYPVEVSAGMASATEVQNAYVRMSDGSVYAWGAGSHGALGNGELEDSKTAVKVHLETATTEETALYGEEEAEALKVVEVDGGSGYALARQKNGRVIGWGGNSIGQLGKGESKECKAHGGTCTNCHKKSTCDPWPQVVQGLAEGGEATKVVQLAVGGSFNLALTKAEKVYSWAKNSPYGQLGLNSEFGPELCGAEGEEASKLCAKEPTLIPELENVTEIGAGFTGGLAVVPSEPARKPSIWTVPGSHSITVKWTFPLQGESPSYQIRYGTLGPGAGESPAVKNWPSAPETSCSVASPCEETLTGLEERPYQINVRLLAKHGTETEQVNQRTAIAAPTLSKPVVLGVNTFKGGLEGGTPVTIAGVGFEEGATVTFGGVAASEVKYVSPQLISVRSPAKEAAGVVHVVVSDTLGTSATGPNDQFYYGEFPVVKKVAPVKGPVTGGVTVTITGSGFTGAEAVMFGSVPASKFVVETSGKIVAESPEQAAGPVDVTVQTPGGTSSITPEDEYKVAPVISSVEPNHGSHAGGTLITIKGAGFLPGETTIKVGGTKSKTVTCVSSTECTAITPEHKAEAVHVTALVEGITSVETTANKYTYE